MVAREFVKEPHSASLWFEIKTGVILLRVVHAHEIEMSAIVCFVVGCVAGRRKRLRYTATTSGLGVSHGTSVEESQADPELVPLTSVQGECGPVEKPHAHKLWR